MNQLTEKPARGRPKTLDRDHILHVAMINYWTSGANAISVNEICKLANVSKPSLYREFTNEDGLRTAVLEHYHQKMTTQLYAIIDAEHSFLETVEQLINALKEKRQAQDLPCGCLHANMIELRDQFGELAVSKIDHIHQDSLNHYKAWVDRAKARGEIITTPPTLSIATYIDAQIRTAIRLPKENVPLHIIEDFLRLAFSALLPKKEKTS